MAAQAAPVRHQPKKLRDIIVYDGINHLEGASWFANFEQEAYFAELTPAQCIRQLEVLFPVNSYSGTWLKEWLADVRNLQDADGNMVTDQVKYDRLKEAFLRNFSMDDEHLMIMMAQIKQVPGELARMVLGKLRSLNSRRRIPVSEDGIVKLFVRALGSRIESWW